jgi:hypothetical protein
MGKSRDPSKNEADEHVSRPLSALKDPASFGPPPKNVNYHGGAALPNEITPQRSGWGAPLSSQQLESANRAANGPTEEEIEEEKKKAGPPLPYRADRTGLRTEHLPPPPAHRDRREVEPVEEAVPAPIAAKPQPRLPPRLPSRQSTTTSIAAPSPASPPPAYDPVPAAQPEPQPQSSHGINSAAATRLGNAGISVPALGIGGGQSSNPWRNEQGQSSQARSPPPPTQSTNQLSELQARFARMNSNTSTATPQDSTPPFVTPAQSPAPSTTSQQPASTTWAEKQGALRTAQSAYKDPSSVTVADAASAAKTANTFRERHKDTIDAAGVRASSFNKKYNVTGRLGNFLEKANAEPAPGANGAPVNGNGSGIAMQHQPVAGQATSPELAASISRKPPPPPPPKKPAGMHGNAAGTAPPPVPLGTRPSFT